VPRRDCTVVVQNPSAEGFRPYGRIIAAHFLLD
jgi:hypothetical protein